MTLKEVNETLAVLLAQIESLEATLAACPSCAAPTLPCASSPCLHLATCVDTSASTYTCACAPGYTGALCDTFTATAFQTIWNPQTGDFAAPLAGLNQIRLPLHETGTYNFVVSWGDGTNSTITHWNQSEVIHTYNVSVSAVTVDIHGTLVGWAFSDQNDAIKLEEVTQWGALRLGNTGSYFYNCINMDVSATDTLDLTGTTTLVHAFRNCVSFTGTSLSSLDVSQVTDTSSMFQGCQNLAAGTDLSLWDVGNKNAQGAISISQSHTKIV